ncbi:MAG: FAD-dependent 5-carboxymethylaminomethyl-2-thiouridine(34) oxidoreductase MnmC [Leptospirales bacterium]|nr:FAD-dependent 5-carboxymethylaminomethyl-2-thiouridine(34) oxidoreductase MnmC [Leptospirales bacterium]
MRSGTFSETLIPADLDWKGNEPRSTLYDDIYFMPGSGIEESTYVFLDSNQLSERFASLSGSFNILETGFGTGLNFILTCARFQSHAKSGFLNFVSCEKHPLRLQDLKRALAPIESFSHLRPWVERLISSYPPLISGFHHCYIAPNVRLTLILGDARETLPLVQGKFQAFYLDGFAPSKNPDFWDSHILLRLSRLADSDATLATFSSAGSVQRALREAGFEVEKRPGFGAKREMIAARFKGRGDTQLSGAWTKAGEKRALVIGAGLAGCSAAFALAARGIAVTLVDEKTAESYPPEFRGIFHPALAAERTAWHRWTLAAFGYLTILLSNIRAGASFCGVFQSAPDERETQRLARAVANLPEDLVYTLSAMDASARIGVSISHNGIFFPRGGVVSPATLCDALLAASGLSVQRGIRIASLTRESTGWFARDNGSTTGRIKDRFDIVIIAAGPGTPAFGLIKAPFDIVRGQMHYLPESLLPGLKSVICHSGYLAPGTTLAAGSTYDRQDLSSAANISGQKEILQNLKSGVPDLTFVEDLMPGFVGLRIACKDRMPIIGPVEGHPGLYVSAGHGSRGILSSPLAGEIIAAHACDDPIPVESDLFAHFSNRYALRHARRNSEKGQKN